jgi:hypothetical protein
MACASVKVNKSQALFEVLAAEEPEELPEEPELAGVLFNELFSLFKSDLVLWAQKCTTIKRATAIRTATSPMTVAITSSL